jgi:hypothetical protein
MLVEGWFDLFQCEDNTIPLCGSILSKENSLVQKLVNNNSEVYLALDPDAIKKSFSISSMLLGYGLDVFFVEISPYKDMGEMNKKEAARRRQNAIPVTDNFLFRKKMELAIGA